MSSGTLMLGVSGLRGLVGESLTPELACRYAGAVAGWLAGHAPGARPVVILGRDGRRGGEAVAGAARAGLLAGGCDVIDLDIAMTPTIGVIVDALSATAGMVVTASHNPQQWNGLKIILAGPGGEGANARSAAPGAALASQIVERFQRGEVALAPWDAVGALTHRADHNETHVELVCEALSSLEGGSAAEPGEGRVALLDSVNGSGVIPGRLLLEELGCERVEHLGAEPGGVFWHEPEPIAENLTLTSDRAKVAGAAVGFIQDPDADRLALLDASGRFIGEEYTLALVAESVLSAMGDRAGGQALCTNLSTSRMIDDIAARHGARVVRTPVGEAHVVEAMRTHGAVLGGEGNGGVIWPAVTCVRDSLSAMALILSLMARRNASLADLVASIPTYAIEKRKTPLNTRSDASPALKRIADAYESDPRARVDLQDGVRIDFDADRAWVHVRPSNTEPILRMIAEAPDAAAATRLLDQIAGFI